MNVRISGLIATLVALAGTLTSGRGGGLGPMFGAALVAAAAFSTGAAAQTLTTLHSFDGSDGAEPRGGLIADAAGNLYGTTVLGGASGDGTVFELMPSGTLSVLHSFAGSDGAQPYAGLIADAAGNLYGTTVAGGASIFCGAFGCGTVFELTPTRTFRVLHSFARGDGAEPEAGLIADAAGNLYGTTNQGGAGTNCAVSGCGTVFELRPTGTLSVLHSFAVSDGAQPSAGLIADAAGNLYGTTAIGGASTNCPSPAAPVGCGTVFKLTTTGTFSVLHSFTLSDGAQPSAGLIADAAGNLYGTTAVGAPGVAGTVFELTPTGTLTVLHGFARGEGEQPQAGLIADAAGNLYGTTAGGGASTNCGAFGCGAVFKLTPTGTLSVLHNFTGSDGAEPFAGLIADAAGNLYGTTVLGGASGDGTVFKLAGSGFVSTVRFAWLDAGLIIRGGQRARFELDAKFGLGASSNGINPPSEPVTLRIGPYTATIPAGSFRRLPSGKHWSVYAFIGEENNVQLSLDILSLGPNSYQLGATGGPTNLTVPNRMPVSLQIGDNSGSAVVKAVRLH